MAGVRDRCGGPMRHDIDAVFFVRCRVGRELTDFEKAVVREFVAGRHVKIQGCDEVVLAASTFLELETAIKEAMAAEKKARDQLDDALRSTIVVCRDAWGQQGGCKAKWPIGQLQYRQTYWYDRGGPYESGCWMPGEGQFVCPKCGYCVRLCANHEWINKLSHLFASIVEVKDL